MSITTATILDINGATIAEGLQTCRESDAAIQAAHRLVDDATEGVILVDADGTWLVTPDHEATRLTEAQCRDYGVTFVAAPAE